MRSSGKRAFLIGLTGSFGTGKSTVATFFKRWGAKVIDADRLGHEALKKNTATYRQVICSFGRSILKRNGDIDRKRLAKRVFENKSMRKQLERIIHPYVFKRIWAITKRTRTGVVVIEIPLLFETGFDRRVDKAVTVSVRKGILLRRLERTRNMNRHEIENRLNAQLSMAQKRKKSDFVIDNNSTKSELLKQARSVWAKIKN